MSFLGQYQALLQRVETAVDKALDTEVAKSVKDIMEEQLELQVYSYEASQMAMAARRLDSGGLLDRQFMVSHVEEGHQLTVEDTAPFQGDPVNYTTLSDVVERGTEGFKQPGARPFVSGTQSEAVSSGRAYSALMDGMKRQGF